MGHPGGARILLFVFVIFLFADLIQAAPLDSCNRLFDDRAFRPALECAEGVLHSPALLLRSDSLKGLELCGVLSYLLEDFEGADRYFDRIVRIDSGYALDPVQIPPEIVALYANRKIAVRNERTALHVAPAKSYGPAGLLPFGVSQYVKGRRTRAWVYAGLAVSGLAVNIGAYQARKSGEADDGTYPDADRARRLYYLQLSGFYGLFLATGVVSFADALFTR